MPPLCSRGYLSPLLFLFVPPSAIHSASEFDSPQLISVFSPLRSSDTLGFGGPEGSGGGPDWSRSSGDVPHSGSDLHSGRVSEPTTGYLPPPPPPPPPIFTLPHAARTMAARSPPPEAVATAKGKGRGKGKGETPDARSHAPAPVHARASSESASASRGPPAPYGRHQDARAAPPYPHPQLRLDSHSYPPAFPSPAGRTPLFFFFHCYARSSLPPNFSCFSSFALLPTFVFFVPSPFCFPPFCLPVPA